MSIFSVTEYFHIFHMNIFSVTEYFHMNIFSVTEYFHMNIFSVTEYFHIFHMNIFSVTEYFHIFHMNIFSVTEYVAYGELHQLWQSLGTLPENLVALYVAEIAVTIGLLLLIITIIYY